MGKWKHTQNDIRGQASTRVLRDESENLPQACNKANEETYPSPLLVNIKLI